MPCAAQIAQADIAKGIGFTEDQVKALWAYISRPTPNVASRRQSGRSSQSATYTDLMGRLLKEKAEKKQKR